MDDQPPPERPKPEVFDIVVIWHETKNVGEAFTMLTMASRPIAPYHDRQRVVLKHDIWSGWFDPSIPAQSLIRQQPEESLLVVGVG